MPSPANADAGIAAGYGTVRLAAICLFVLLRIRIVLFVRGYGAVRARMPAAAGAAQSRFYARQLARHIERVGDATRMSCLVQALGLQYLLARSGHACTIRIGVRETRPGRFAAHAWVVCDDVVVLGQRDTPLHAFTPLTELA